MEKVVNKKESTYFNNRNSHNATFSLFIIYPTVKVHK